MKTKVLLVDEKAELEGFFRRHFHQSIRNGSYEFVFVTTAGQALQLLEEQADIDVLLTNLSGLSLLDYLPRINPIVRTVVFNANGDVTTVRKAMNYGAFALLTTPLNFQELKATIDKARQYAHQLRETQELMQVDAHKTHFFSHLTHELQSPLSLLVSTVNRLFETADLPLTQPLLAVRRNARQLLRAINELEAIAQQESLKIELVGRDGILSGFTEQLAE